MAPGLVLIPVSPSRAFRFNEGAVPCCSSSANSIPCFPSALVHGVDSYQRAQSSLHSGCLPLSRLLAIPSPFVSPALHKMLRERPRMGCRRGSSRGLASRRPSSTTSNPSSDTSKLYCNRYPATRSGRGRVRGQVIAEECSHHSHSHTARFRIPCSLGNSSFIVSVTVEMCEDAVGSGEVNPGAPLEHQRADQNVSQRRDLGSLPTLNSNANADPNAPAGGDPSSSAAHPSESKDTDQFGCRIVEEQPSTSDED